VHPEGHVAQRIARGEGHVAQRIASKRVAPLEHGVHPEGHVAWMIMKENLNDPKTLTPMNF
jgi:hypothetical protein